MSVEQNELSGPQQILQQPVFGKGIHCVFSRKNPHYIVTVYMKIKVTAIQEDFFTSCFLSEKINQQSEEDHRSITSPLHLPLYMVPWVLTWTKT